MRKMILKVSVAVGILGTLSLFVGCGDAFDEKKEAASNTEYTFSEINDILKMSCAQNGGCHESGNTAGVAVYVGNKDNFIADKSSIIDRINGVGALMPQAGSGLSLTSDEIEKIENYLGQNVKN